MSRLLLFCACFALASCSSTQKDHRERALLHLQIGTSLLNQGKSPAALRELLAAENLDPSNPVIQNNLGLAFFLRGKPEEAERRFRRALDLDPKFTDARNNLGRVLIEKKSYEQAIQQLKRAVDDLVYQFPDRSHFNLGYAYFKTGRYSEAKRALLKSLEFNRNNCPALGLYGRSLLELRDFKLAAESLDQASERCRETLGDEALFYSGMAYISLGERDKALARFDEQLSLYPKGQLSEKAREALELLR